MISVAKTPRIILKLQEIKVFKFQLQLTESSLTKY